MSLDRLINILVTITLIEMMVTDRAAGDVRRAARHRQELAAGRAGRGSQLSARSRGGHRSARPVRSQPDGRRRISRPRGLPRRALRPAVRGDRASERARRSRLDGGPGGIVGDRFAAAVAGAAAVGGGRRGAAHRLDRNSGRPARHAAAAPASRAAGEAPASQLAERLLRPFELRQQDLESGPSRG